MDPRHIPSFVPKVTSDTLSAKFQDGNHDKGGSYTGNRRGPLRGAPSVTWFSLANAGMPKKMTANIGEEPVLYIQGYNMFTTSNIYLSASNPNMFEESPRLFDFFEKTYTNRLSSENPAISAVPLSGWTILDNSNMYFKLPKIKGSGTLDVVLQGPAGYNLMSSGSYSESEEPYKYIQVICSINFIEAQINCITNINGKFDCIIRIDGTHDCISIIDGNIQCGCIYSFQTTFGCISTIDGAMDCITAMDGDMDCITVIDGDIQCDNTEFETVLTEDILPGDSIFQVEDISGLSPGDIIVINAGTPLEEYFSIASLGSVLPKNYPIRRHPKGSPCAKLPMFTPDATVAEQGEKLWDQLFKDLENLDELDCESLRNKLLEAKGLFDGTNPAYNICLEYDDAGRCIKHKPLVELITDFCGKVEIYNNLPFVKKTIAGFITQPIVNGLVREALGPDVDFDDVIKQAEKADEMWTSFRDGWMKVKATLDQRIKDMVRKKACPIEGMNDIYQNELDLLNPEQLNELLDHFMDIKVGEMTEEERDSYIAELIGRMAAGAIFMIVSFDSRPVEPGKTMVATINPKGVHVVISMTDTTITLSNGTVLPRNQSPSEKSWYPVKRPENDGPGTIQWPDMDDTSVRGANERDHELKWGDNPPENLIGVLDDACDAIEAGIEWVDDKLRDFSDDEYWNEHIAPILCHEPCGPGTYELSTEKDYFVEGETIEVTLNTTNVPGGTSVPYQVYYFPEERYDDPDDTNEDGITSSSITSGTFVMGPHTALVPHKATATMSFSVPQDNIKQGPREVRIWATRLDGRILPKSELPDIDDLTPITPENVEDQPAGDFENALHSITVDDAPDPILTLSGPTEVCRGECIDITLSAKNAQDGTAVTFQLGPPAEDGEPGIKRDDFTSNVDNPDFPLNDKNGNISGTFVVFNEKATFKLCTSGRGVAGNEDVENLKLVLSNNPSEELNIKIKPCTTTTTSTSTTTTTTTEFPQTQPTSPTTTFTYTTSTIYTTTTPS